MQTGTVIVRTEFSVSILFSSCKNTLKINVKAYSGKIFSISTLSPCFPQKLSNSSSVKPHRVGFSLCRVCSLRRCVSGTRRSRRARVAETIEGDAVDFEVGVGGEENLSNRQRIIVVFCLSVLWVFLYINN